MDTSPTNTSVRYAFFAFAGLMVVILTFLVVRANRRRVRNGQAPIQGTRWMTPPSYLQSQQQHNPQRPEDLENVAPPYSASAHPHDLGHFDQNGQFHANPNAEELTQANIPRITHQVPETPENNASLTYLESSPREPEPAHNRENRTNETPVQLRATVPPMISPTTTHPIT